MAIVRLHGVATLLLLLLVQDLDCQTINNTETTTEAWSIIENATNTITMTKEFVTNANSTQITEHKIENSTNEMETDYGIRYYLYTRKHPIIYTVLGNRTMLKGTDFDINRPTVMIIHGFTGSGDTTSVTLIRDAFLYTEDVNVISVHWEDLAKGPDYEMAANNTQLVARHIARTIEHLVKEEGVTLKSLHVIGFSLGAQVAGQAGSFLSIGKLPRITALDPAGPIFHTRKDEERLDASDAEFVFVLHTSGGFVSFEEPLGHADFYPNGGKSPQPACEDQVVKLVCSHLIAPLYFTESIYNEKAFSAVKCTSWLEYTEGLCQDTRPVFMGPHTDPSTRGLFYLHTNAMEPYGQGAVPVMLKDNTLYDVSGPGREGRRVELQGDRNNVDVEAVVFATASSRPQSLNTFIFAACIAFLMACLPKFCNSICQRRTV